MEFEDEEEDQTEEQRDKFQVEELPNNSLTNPSDMDIEEESYDEVP